MVVNALDNVNARWVGCSCRRQLSGSSVSPSAACLPQWRLVAAASARAGWSQLLHPLWAAVSASLCASSLTRTPFVPSPSLLSHAACMWNPFTHTPLRVTPAAWPPSLLPHAGCTWTRAASTSASRCWSRARWGPSATPRWWCRASLRTTVRLLGPHTPQPAVDAAAGASQAPASSGCGCWGCCCCLGGCMLRSAALAHCTPCLLDAADVLRSACPSHACECQPLQLSTSHVALFPCCLQAPAATRPRSRRPCARCTPSPTTSTTASPTRGKRGTVDARAASAAVNCASAWLPLGTKGQCRCAACVACSAVFTAERGERDRISLPIPFRGPSTCLSPFLPNLMQVGV